MPKPLDPALRKRLRDKFTKLLCDQVRPWAYLDTDGVEVVTFDGKVIAYPNPEAQGAEQLFWGRGYIEPFLRDTCLVEAGAWAKERGLGAREAFLELRNDFVENFVRVYWTMADVHRHLWPLPDRGRRPTTTEVDGMVAFVDEQIRTRP
jgi:hypothetical protein